MNGYYKVQKLNRVEYKYRISEYNGNYYVMKIHPCGVPEAITRGTKEYCKNYINSLKGQQSLFDLDEIKEG